MWTVKYQERACFLYIFRPFQSRVLWWSRFLILCAAAINLWIYKGIVWVWLQFRKFYFVFWIIHAAISAYLTWSFIWEESRIFVWYFWAIFLKEFLFSQMIASSCGAQLSVLQREVPCKSQNNSVSFYINEFDRIPWTLLFPSILKDNRPLHWVFSLQALLISWFALDHAARLIFVKLGASLSIIKEPSNS